MDKPRIIDDVDGVSKKDRALKQWAVCNRIEVPFHPLGHLISLTGNYSTYKLACEAVASGRYKHVIFFENDSPIDGPSVSGEVTRTDKPRVEVTNDDRPNMLEAALDYARKGRKIFPCCWPDENGVCACPKHHKKAIGKAPLPIHGSSEATSDTEQIRKWWEKWPNANIGMSTTGRVIADFDKGKDGEKSRTALEAEHGKLPSTLTHRTGGGGLHYIYDNPTGEKVTSVNGLRDGVDRKADGGYIIMPPSLHPSQGRYEALNEEEIALAPEWLMKLKKKPSPESEEDTLWYIKVLEGVGEGERNETATRLAGRYARAGLSQREIWLLMSKWNEKNMPPMDEGELKTTIESIYSKESANIVKPLPLIDLNKVESKDVEWLWRPYIPLGMVTIMDGDPGECKSWLALAIASKVSLGEYGRGPANVIVASLEDDEEYAIKPRLEGLGADISRIKTIDKNFPIMLDSKGLKIIEGYVKETHAELLILDPIIGFMSIDINRANEMRSIMSQLRRIAGENKCAILCIRHLTKPGKGLPTKAIYKGLGSIDLIAAARSGLLVGHTEDEDDNMIERGMAHIKSNYAARGDPVGFEIISDGYHGFFSWNKTICNVTTKGMLGVIKKGSKTYDAKIWLRDMLTGEPISSRLIYMKADKEGISERTLDRAKKALGVVSINRGKNEGWYWALEEGVEGREK